MAMSLGDFFNSAPSARPVSPRPVKFTAVAKGKTLPGGTANPHGRPVAATITAAFVFLGGDGAQSARVESREFLRKKFVDDRGIPLETDNGDFNVELTYQILWRVLHEWDEDARSCGGRIFPCVDEVRGLVEMQEANRLLAEYNKYVADEHPEELDKPTFRDAQRPGEKLAAVASR